MKKRRCRQFWGGCDFAVYPGLTDDDEVVIKCRHCETPAPPQSCGVCGKRYSVLVPNVVRAEHRDCMTADMFDQMFAAIRGAY